jgi:hypothetical protein
MSPTDPRTNPEPEPICRSCGYDLRGTASTRCSECSAPIGVRLVFYSLAEYQRARDLLALHGLLLDSKVELEKVAEMSVIGRPINYTGTGLCFASLERWSEVCALLEPEGLLDFDDEPARPIVDRSEPICPSCGVALDRGGPAACESCGKEFTWIDVEALNPDENPSDSAVSKPSLGALVESAVGPLSSSRSLLLTLVAILLVTLLPISTIGMLFTTLNGDEGFERVALLLFAIIAVAAAVCAGALQWVRRHPPK